MKPRQVIVKICLVLMLFSGEQSALSRPLLSFFSELEAEELHILISRPGVKETLVNMQAELRIGISDFTEVHAQNIRQLNDAGIPVYAWLKANDTQGHTFRVDNASSLLKRYRNFKEWTDSYNLRWQAVGIDLRPNPDDMQSWVNQPLLSAWNSYVNLFSQEEIELAANHFQEFLKEAHKDGYRIESYVLPFAMDEVSQETKGLQYMSRILNVETDKIIPLCYTSFPYISPASILDYGGRAQSVAIGSTNNSILGEKLSTEALDWEMLSRDLRLAHDVCKEIHISNLESVIANGWLEAIMEFDFSVPVFLYSKELEIQENQSFWAEKAFQALTYPITSSIVLLLLAILSIIFCFLFIRYLFSWKKKNSAPQQVEIDYEIISNQPSSL